MAIKDNILAGTKVGEQAELLGRPTPITQAGALAVGATNQDSVKMTGTPNQKLASIQQAIKRSTDVESSTAGVEARQHRLTPAQQEKERQAQAARLRQFGDADERIAKAVQETTEKQVRDASVKEGASTLVVNKNSDLVLRDPTLAADLEALRKNPNDVAAMARVQQKTGLSTLDDMMKSELFVKDPTSALSTLSAAIPNDVKMGLLDDEDWKGMGFSNTDEAARTLGIDAASLKNMDWKTFQEKVTELRDSGYSTTREIQARMADPTIGQATRQALNQQMIERGEVGARAADELVGDLEAQINNGTEVSIGGVTISVQDMLDDTEMQTLISDLIDSPEKLDALPDTDPFKQWYKANESALVKWKQAAGETLVKSTANRKSWEDTRKLPGAGGLTLDDDTMKILSKGKWNPSGAQAADPSGYVPAFSLLKNPAVNNELKANFVATINTAKTKGYTSLVDSLSSVRTETDMSKLLAGMPTLIKNMDSLNLVAEARKVGGDTAASTQFFSSFFGDGKIPEKIKELSSTTGINKTRQEIIPDADWKLLPPAKQKEVLSLIQSKVSQIASKPEQLIKQLSTSPTDILQGNKTNKPVNPLEAAKKIATEELRKVQQAQTEVKTLKTLMPSRAGVELKKSSTQLMNTLKSGMITTQQATDMLASNKRIQSLLTLIPSKASAFLNPISLVSNINKETGIDSQTIRNLLGKQIQATTAQAKREVDRVIALEEQKAKALRAEEEKRRAESSRRRDNRDYNPATGSGRPY